MYCLVFGRGGKLNISCRSIQNNFRCSDF